MCRLSLVLVVALFAACSTGRPAATPTPIPTAGPPRGAEPVVSSPPTVPDNTPTPLPGGTNGQLQATDLVQVIPTCLTARDAAPSMQRLLQDAHAHRVTLTTEICYRPEENQTRDRASACAGGNCACAAPTGHSMHGWGKAADFKDAHGSIVSVTNPTHVWLQANAPKYGWNHPRWAEPGGGPCPEPWHWEWVGDGGSMHRSPVRVDAAAIVADGAGYAICTALGAVVARGQNVSFASSPSTAVGRLVVGAAATTSGLLTVDAIGTVRAYGEAKALQNAATSDVVGIAAAQSGYWLVTYAGHVSAFGEARDYGSSPGPVVGIAATRDGKGYWLAGANGTVYPFGDATPPSAPVATPVVAIAASAHGGYWLVTRDGRVIAQNGAPYLGSLASPPRLAVVSIAGTPSGYGYWLLTADGGVFAFGDAPYAGTE